MILSTFADPTDWTLEVSPAAQAAIWQQSQVYPTAGGRWNGYLNQLCLETILPWLKAEHFPTATAWIEPARQPMFWDAVNGAIMMIGTKRIALIPTESIDQAELEVQQEWVDIPSWAADYYLGVQVFDGEISIYGYTTHKQLKTQGVYDAIDRTYCLDVEATSTDLNGLWLMLDRYTVAETRASIAPIVPIASDRVTPLLDRLSQSTTIVPRLAVPFQLWAAIVEQPETLAQLYAQRTGTPVSPVTRLSGWFGGQIDAVWQALDLILQPQQIATAVRGANSTAQAQSDIYRAKTYALPQGEIALVIGISYLSATESRIGLQIHPAGGATQLPGATRMRLLTIDGSEIGQASATVTETIQFQFRASLGEQFQIEIECDGQTWIEKFEQ